MNIDKKPANQVPDQAPSADTDQLEPGSKIADQQRVAPFFQHAKDTIPTLVVMGLLAAVGYFGHHYGWKVPKFSQLTGQQGESGVLWCDEHGVPEADCIACNADLMPKGELVGCLLYTSPSPRD